MEEINELMSENYSFYMTYEIQSTLLNCIPVISIILLIAYNSVAQNYFVMLFSPDNRILTCYEIPLNCKVSFSNQAIICKNFNKEVCSFEKIS